MLITSSINESGFWGLKPGGDPARYVFTIQPYYQHMVGDRSGSKILLATKHERVFRRCGGVFPPCDYLVAGPIVSASAPIDTGRRPPYQNLVLDVGMPLSLARRIDAVSGRSFDRPMVDAGEWVAAIGRVDTLFFSAPGPDEPAALCRPIEGHGVDLNPESPTFGTLMSWPLGTVPPHDPDVIGFPICFVTFEVIDAPDGARCAAEHRAPPGSPHER